MKPLSQNEESKRHDVGNFDGPGGSFVRDSRLGPDHMGLGFSFTFETHSLSKDPSRRGWSCGPLFCNLRLFVPCRFVALDCAQTCMSYHQNHGYEVLCKDCVMGPATLNKDIFGFTAGDSFAQPAPRVPVSRDMSAHDTCSLPSPIRVQVPKRKLSAQNHGHDSYHKTRNSSLIGYFGPYLGYTNLGAS